MKLLYITAFLALIATTANAQSFGQDVLNQVQQENAQTPYGQAMQNNPPMQQPVIYNGNGVFTMPNGEPVDTTVNGQPFTQFPAQ